MTTAKVIDADFGTGRSAEVTRRIRAVEDRIIDAGLVETLARELAPDGEVRGSEYVALNPGRKDTRIGSFSLDLDRGLWGDFAAGQSGRLFDYVLLCRGQGDGREAVGAALEWLESWAGSGGADSWQRKNAAGTRAKKRALAFKPVEFPGLGRPDRIWHYFDRGGASRLEVWRWDTGPDRADKEVRFGHMTPEGWLWAWPDAPMCVYREVELVSDPGLPVLICEGERAADAAQQLLPGWFVTCSAFGSGQARRTDWGALAGRRVAVWPDLDEPGAKYAETVRRLALEAGAVRVEILDVSGFVGAMPKGWDAADAAGDGWTADDVGRIWGATLNQVQHGEPMGLEALERDSEATEGEEDTPGSEEDQEGADAADDGDQSGDVIEWTTVEIGDLDTADVQAPEFVIGRLVPRGHVAMLAGDGESGKSFIGLIWAVHCVLGMPWGGLSVQKGRALFLSLEDDGPVIRDRLRRVMNGYGVMGRLGEVAEGLRVIDGTRGMPLMVERFNAGVKEPYFTAEYERLREEVEAFQPDLLVIDNVSDAFAADEIARRQVRKFVRGLGDLVKGHNGAVLLLAHFSKNGANAGGGKHAYSGSTAWANSSRSVITLASGRIEHVKSNLCAKMEEPIPVAWIDGIWRPDIGGIQAMRDEKAQAEIDMPVVLRAIQECVNMGNSVSASNATTANAWLSLAMHLPNELQGKDGKQRTLAAVRQLWLAKRIRQEETKGANGRARVQWVVNVDSGRETRDGEAADPTTTTT